MRSADALVHSPAIGAIWETFVFAQLRQRERRNGRRQSLFFWRDRSREVDFVVETGRGIELLEDRGDDGHGSTPRGQLNRQCG